MVINNIPAHAYQHQNTPSYLVENMARLGQVDYVTAEVRNKGYLAEFITVYRAICLSGDPWSAHPITGNNLQYIVKKLTPCNGDLYSACNAIYGDLIDATLVIECVYDWESWAY